MMFKSISMVIASAIMMCVVTGCGGNQGGNTMENAQQSDIEAYEAALAAEEAAMSKDFQETK